jgi:hypothetical protein
MHLHLEDHDLNIRRLENLKSNMNDVHKILFLLYTGKNVGNIQLRSPSFQVMSKFSSLTPTCNNPVFGCKVHGQ